MHQFLFPKKALTKVQAAVIAAIVIVAVVAGLVYYLSLSTPATNS